MRVGRPIAVLLLLAALGYCGHTGLADPAADERSASAVQPPAAEPPQDTPERLAAAQTAFHRDVEPLVNQYCQACHTGAEPKGELKLEEYLVRATVSKDRETWEKVAKKLHDREMPPEGEPQPSDAERQQITAWIDAELAVDRCGSERDPGRVTIRRLNRNEYNNTIRDLVGIDFHPADDFPSDDVGYGFDNIGDVLTMPTILLEKYLSAAEKVVERALGTEQVSLVTEELTGGQLLDSCARILASKAEIRTSVRMFGTGDYLFRVRAYGEQAGDEPAKMSLYLDDTLVRTFDVKATEGKSEIYEGWLSSKGGKHTYSVVFLNDFYQTDGADKIQDRNLVVEKLELMGPYSTTFREIIGREHTPDDKTQLAREIISGFITGRAFRRPAAPHEIDRVMKLVEMADRDGENFNTSIGLGLQAILVSPHFLFRVELDPEPNTPGAIRTLNDFELATRLSYFLWSSMPDDELLTLARLGQLRAGDQLERQVKRMLADPKSDAMVEHFAGQWLQLRNLKIAAPDKTQYPDFDEALRAAMQKETELFFAEVMREDRSVLDFLDGSYTFLNERLARHYGITDVKGEAFRKVSLDSVPLGSDQRGGVLSHASVLTVTSNPTRTSPVKRGKWILENILGTPPPPPPPEVPELKDESGEMATGTLRERMEQHRANPSCAICHKTMDPLGFGLENYDGIGASRASDGRFEIDASGTLPNGQTFAGPKQLKGILKERRSDFVRALAERMLTYGLGRGVEYSDRCTVTDIALAMEQNDYRFSSMILAIVRSDAFQKRRGKGTEQ